MSDNREIAVYEGDVDVHSHDTQHDSDGNSRRDVIRQIVDRQLGRQGAPPLYAEQIQEDKRSRSTPSRYANLPASVKQEIQEYAPLKPFADLARKNGTDIVTAVGNYSRLEKTLATNPLLGYGEIMSRMGHTPKGMVDAWLPYYNVSQRDFAQAIDHDNEKCNFAWRQARF